MNKYNVNFIEDELFDLKLKLKSHPLYSNLKSINDIKVFMEFHVFAVWDFMSLLKSLQNLLTNNKVPWYPIGNPLTRRFINEIVLGEESDFDVSGNTKSHFEMYIDSMKEIGADTTQIKMFIKNIKDGQQIFHVIEELDCQKNLKYFLNHTFNVIESFKSHQIASAFTFGREDVIPDMFIEILNKSSVDQNKFKSLRYYFDRHIELDGDKHGPLSLQMISELCGDDKIKWIETLDIAKESLSHRILLWDSINEAILLKSN